jgi:hypothetical protein
MLSLLITINKINLSIPFLRSNNTSYDIDSYILTLPENKNATGYNVKVRLDDVDYFLTVNSNKFNLKEALLSQTSLSDFD